MNYSKRHQQWIVLNLLMFLPWASCGRIDFTHDSEQNYSPERYSNRDSSIYFPDDDDRPSRSPFRASPSRGPNFRTSQYRRANNPDFFFDYIRDGAGRNSPKPSGRNLISTRRNQRGRQSTREDAHGGEFSYYDKDKNGPSNWYRFAPQCGGRYQSPVFLDSHNTLDVENKRPLQLIGQSNQPQSVKLANDGHSAKFTFEWSEGERPFLRGGPLKNKYFFEQFHFHWGSNDSVGSEHVLNNERFPMELHLVFYNGLYESFDEAKEQVDGLAVVGIFYQIDEVYDEPLNLWIRFLREIIEPDTDYDIPSDEIFSVYDIIGDIDWWYFSYEGSLTTPPCLETVTWIIATKSLPIKAKELREFRRLRSRSGLMVNNFRPLQKLYNRRMFLY